MILSARAGDVGDVEGRSEEPQPILDTANLSGWRTKEAP